MTNGEDDIIDLGAKCTYTLEMPSEYTAPFGAVGLPVLTADDDHELRIIGN